MNTQDQHSSNGFWFGLIMGGTFGAAGLYFFGTEEGRTKLRAFLDKIEDMDGDVLDNVRDILDNPAKQSHKVVGDIHAVLDKIQSTIPESDQMRKYFSKDGKKVTK